MMARVLLLALLALGCADGGRATPQPAPTPRLALVPVAHDLYQVEGWTRYGYEACAAVCEASGLMFGARAHAPGQPWCWCLERPAPTVRYEPAIVWCATPRPTITPTWPPCPCDAPPTPNCDCDLYSRTGRKPTIAQLRACYDDCLRPTPAPTCAVGLRDTQPTVLR